MFWPDPRLKKPLFPLLLAKGWGRQPLPSSVQNASNGGRHKQGSGRGWSLWGQEAAEWGLFCPLAWAED